jgi:hypothetical protein
MESTILYITKSAILGIVCVCIPVGILLWVWSRENKPLIPFRHLWNWVKHQVKDWLSGGMYSKRPTPTPTPTLADRYKALKKKRAEETGKQDAILTAQHVVVCRIQQEIIEIVRTETGATLDDSSDADSICKHRCDFALGGHHVDFMWLEFHDNSDELCPSTLDALPYWVERIVTNTKDKLKQQS